MKLICKLLYAPISIAVSLLTWVCAGLIACTVFAFRLASGILSALALLVLFAVSVKNGLIPLVIAFLISPMGVPALAVWLLAGVESLNKRIREI